METFVSKFLTSCQKWIALLRQRERRSLMIIIVARYDKSCVMLNKIKNY